MHALPTTSVVLYSCIGRGARKLRAGDDNGVVCIDDDGGARRHRASRASVEPVRLAAYGAAL
jgi:hypothetical protein